MPIYMPQRAGQKAKRRTTAAERRNFVAQNIRKKCSVATCIERRTWTSSWCPSHRTNQARHGHPQGRALDPRLVETFRVRFAAFLDLYEDAPQVPAALEVMSDLLRGKLISRRSLAQRELSRLRDGERHPGDHATGPTTAREALEAVGSVFFVSLYRPEVLHDDARLAYALAGQLFKCKILQAYPRTSRTTGVSYTYHPKPAATGKQDVGGVIRRLLSVFFVHAFERVEADQRRHADRKMTLSTPMSSATGEPDNATSATPGPTPGTVDPTTSQDSQDRQDQPTAPSVAPGEPTTAQLLARARALLARMPAPQPVVPAPVPQPPAAAPQSPHHPAAPGQHPAATPQPASPAQAPQPQPAPALPPAPVPQPATPRPDTPLLPSTLVLERRPSTSSHHAPEPAGSLERVGTFGAGTGGSFEGFDR